MFDKRFSKLIYVFWKYEIYHIAKIAQEDNFLFEEKTRFAVYLFMKNEFIFKIPNSFIVYIFRTAVKRKKMIKNILRTLRNIMEFVEKLYSNYCIKLGFYNSISK